MAASTLQRQAASIIVGGIEGTELSSQERDLLRSLPWAGVTLFKRNVSADNGATQSLIKAIKSHLNSSAIPAVIAVDQEGGRVTRMRAAGFPDKGPPLRLAGGGVDSTAIADIEQYGHAVGAALVDLGFNINFAPVLDIDTEPTNSAIGDRCFGKTAESVTVRASAYLHGLEQSGIRGCLKHFPGQGDAKVDTHVGQTDIQLSLVHLHERELKPFAALIPHAAMVMISHPIYSAISPKPASQSTEIIEQLLRRDMGFSGVVVSDDLNMGAVGGTDQEFAKSVVASLAAGCDMLLVCRHATRMMLAVDVLVSAAESSPAIAARLQAASDRLDRLRSQLLS